MNEAKNPHERRVKDVMSQAVVTASPDDPIREAIVLLEENRLSALPIADKKRRCVGVLSATDLIELTREVDEQLSDLNRVGDVTRQWLIERISQSELGAQEVSLRMTRTVARVDPETSIVDASAEMLRCRVHHLPVLDDQQRVVGIVSSMDLLAAFVEGCPQ